MVKGGNEMSSYNDRRWRPTDEDNDFNYEEESRRGFRRDRRSERERQQFSENFLDDYGNERDDREGRDYGYGQHRSSRRRMDSGSNRTGDIRSRGGFGGERSRYQSDMASERDRSEYYNSDYDRDSDYGYGRGMTGTQGGFYGSSYGYNPDPRSSRQDYGSAYRSSTSEGRRYGQHTGKGPQGYQRSDDRIREDVNDRLTWHGDVDASQITVKVENGEVTLEGHVPDRTQKRLAEDIAEDVRGVKDVHNHLRVDQNLFDKLAKGINDLLGSSDKK
jgi:osmotically-inducible protein OsmY